MRREFSGGDPDIRVVFNDCAGSQTAPLSEPPLPDEDPVPAPPPPATAPPIEKQPGNDFISLEVGLSDDIIIGDGWDDLFA